LKQQTLKLLSAKTPKNSEPSVHYETVTMDSCGHRQLEPCFQSGLRIVSINATNQCFKGQAGFENLGRRILRQPWTSDYETVVPLAGGCRREDRWKLRLSLFPFFREAG